MRGESSLSIIGFSIGVVIGVLLAILAFFCVRYHRKRSQIGNSSSRRAVTLPIRENGADSCIILSDSTIDPESPMKSGRNGMSSWLEGFKKSNGVSMSGIPAHPYNCRGCASLCLCAEACALCAFDNYILHIFAYSLKATTYTHRDLEKALIGKAASGPVYKAQMSTGEIVAVKMLATDSKQGETEFQTKFLRGTTSPPKQQSQLHFSNNAPSRNRSASSMTDVRPGFFPTLQPQFPTPSFNEKPKNISLEVGDSRSVAVKKTSNESASERPKRKNSTPLPPFKVRKEKMGDKITALHQLVSPFGKTDTTSVLSEAIEYIKFLHDQVTVLSIPYMKSGAPIHHQQQQSCDKSEDSEGPKQDLRSRGLCLVPISSTFPVTHETAACTPTFGATFR
ncbi:transcription factor bHLH123-like isoform X3 [Tripterygium wilfordii]|uniref:transcription factor bHLH123-like isoform X3 n=1 Tax=Tripterygium wilfordii TaxID=458696 RepID=UPI0018F83142|nr:transcription factor bHLH123-like isoform X3 [Tripterygium wilfordii]